MCVMSLYASTLYRCLFLFNDTATTEIYTLSLHDALPIWMDDRTVFRAHADAAAGAADRNAAMELAVDQRHRYLRRRSRADRKSTRLNSSHSQISYAVFCLKKKKNKSTYSIKLNTKILLQF